MRQTECTGVRRVTHRVEGAPPPRCRARFSAPLFRGPAPPAGVLRAPGDPVRIGPMIRKPRLFTAGPTPVHPDAVQAAAGPLPYHRGASFVESFDRVQEGLRRIFRTRGPVAVLTTSGTGGMEAAVANLFAPGDRLAAVAGGKFGRRWAEIASAYGMEPAVLDVEPGRVATPAEVADHVEASAPVQGLLLTASETSTGTVFDVRGIARAVRDRHPGLPVAVDAITAVGALPVETDAWDLDAVVGGAQKAFMIPPGLAFVACSTRGWQRVRQERPTPRYYLDLRRYAGETTRQRIPFTPAIGLVIQLEAALAAVEEAGGVTALEANAARLSRAARAAAGALGLELLSDSPSPAVTALRAPESGTAPSIVARLRDRFGAQISGGQGELKPDVFRLGHLGYFDDLDLLGLIAALEHVLAEGGKGHRADPAGAGAAAAARVLAETGPAVDSGT